ncbi:hypothetical protein B0J14DRAFT_606331 [Halenospora varia]|nr:hypothetical protein B0J14DRAFT_606331 [Halenospora varia]
MHEGTIVQYFYEPPSVALSVLLIVLCLVILLKLDSLAPELPDYYLISLLLFKLVWSLINAHVCIRQHVVSFLQHFDNTRRVFVREAMVDADEALLLYGHLARRTYKIWWF